MESCIHLRLYWYYRLHSSLYSQRKEKKREGHVRKHNTLTGVRARREPPELHCGSTAYRA
ncbi:Uncharacterized protein APZ42_018820 [Daphnia magna]|uniref:Uncharacterized protein n=1 Tax=Daphnia magna TaxID=35525 RepID=A0A164YTH3_9CRUS|nr:Uncharacterized protein APZ42_018820 [Daphnia magna]